MTSGLHLAEMAWTTDECRHEDLLLKNHCWMSTEFRRCHPLSKGKGLAFLQMNLCEFWDTHFPYLALDDSDTCELTVTCDLTTHNQRIDNFVYFRMIERLFKEKRNLFFDLIRHLHVNLIVKLEITIFEICNCHLDDFI